LARVNPCGATLVDRPSRSNKLAVGDLDDVAIPDALASHALAMAAKAELREFPKSRRDRLQPVDVGLASSGRRRVPGLRREELATLARVSVDYYIRPEQGRDLTPPESVLDAPARALRLDDTQRAHLFALAMRNRGGRI
jgi:transcriptional regulator with XRE-family HTH domain